MQAMFDKARKLMADKKKQEEQVKEYVALFNKAKEAGNYQECNSIKKTLISIATGGYQSEGQFRKYTKSELNDLKRMRGYSVKH